MYKIGQRLAGLCLAVMAMVLMLTACRSAAAEIGGNPVEYPTSDTSQPRQFQPREAIVPGARPVPVTAPDIESVLDNPVTLWQLQPLQVGEELIIMHTTLGDVTLRLFPQVAPVAVENFRTHAWNGYYDGLIFHRVISNFMIQGGCPDGTGMAGQDIWGGSFGQEFSYELWHFRGALAMAQSAMPNSIGSQFYIVQNAGVSADFAADFRWLSEPENAAQIAGTFEDGRVITYGDVFPADMAQHFLEHGGTPHLDWPFNAGGHTVFGHVVEGMDVVDAIARTPARNDRPVTDVVITHVTFTTYQGAGN